MAFRTWGRLLLTALGVSVLAGAGQLGVAYGFGIVRLTGAFTGTTVNQWPTQLVWVGWFAANAAVVGAVLTGRLARRDAPAPTTGRQLAIGAAAALGATVIAPLCMQPARAAELISVDPVWAVGICAVLGAVIGAGAAIAVLLRPELGWNMAAVAGAVWLLALISVLPSLGTTGPLPTVRLGVLEPSWLDDAAAQRLALLLLPIVALLAGGATAGLARWRGQAPLISGATGVAGPVLVAFAYLTAGPGDAVDRYQATPYYGSLIAILAGALGAAAAALLRWPVGARGAEPQAIEPSDILRPLPAGPELPGATSADSSNEPATADRAAVEPPADPKPATVVPGPWSAEGSDGVRTVPAHWDWPTSTASGQHGPAPTAATTPDTPAKPASWLTDPTGEFTAEARTRRLSPEEGTSSAGPERTPTADVTSTTSAASTSSKAGRAGGVSPAGDDPTDSATTRTNGLPTGERSIGTSSTGATNTGMTSAGTAGTDAVGTAATSTTAAGPGTTNTVTGSTTPASTAATSTTPASTAAASTAAASTAAASTSTSTGAETGAGAGAGAGAASTGTGSTGTGTTDAGSTGAGDTAAPLKPRRARKPKVDPDATSDLPGDRSPTESRGTDGTATGRTRKVTGPGRSDDRTGSGSPMPSAGRPATGSDRATKTPSEARATAEAPAAATDAAGTATTATGPAKPSTSATDAADVPTGTAHAPIAAVAEAVDPSRAPATSAKRQSANARTADPKTPPATGTSPASEMADPKAGSPRTPVGATADSTAPPADVAGGSAADRAGDAAGVRAATEDTSAAGLFGSTTTGDPDTDRWTPARSPWPVSSAWTVPPQAPAQESTASDAPAGSEPSGPTPTPTPTPRPRHRAPLPDLSRASTWNAFDTTRRTGPTESTDRPGPAASSETAAPPERASAPDLSATGSGTEDPASVDTTPTPEKVAEQPSRRGRLGGLFRRNRSRGEESQQPDGATEPLPAQDEEFVDWVAGLSKPVSDNEPEQGKARRSLRSTGRHHRE
ncbi:hypothetical protein [Micromonospora sp. WMMD964]|uniref:hypothetical protein n=1 Tax=Micromonospora sp. WMMD964 TaxID=3016091 RepID=UPI00249CC2D0|nr:hypothetical protein [Micromonospora sp. WMMD964]WFF01476.1 hypothetical protein O7616_01400 [Micromonospora sp. WMMD964]